MSEMEKRKADRRDAYAYMVEVLGETSAAAIESYVIAVGNEDYEFAKSLKAPAHLRSAESRPSSEPPATAGGAPSDDELERIESRHSQWHANDRRRALYEAGERAERAACARLAAHHSDEIAEVIRDRDKPAPPPPASAEKCPACGCLVRPRPRASRRTCR